LKASQKSFLLRGRIRNGTGCFSKALRVHGFIRRASGNQDGPKGVVLLEDQQSDWGPRSKDKLNAVAKEVFDCLGDAFPVCCLSDEFHYFPQIVPPQGVWTG